ncbi:hypothetical protein [Hoeflea poritis]|uniref:Uncharacterized protein n=1 Tax=Hoeflea poritis TaxID=2993659 RepID=A0ABT4VH70_9HYPH|nr:hypothetical protein [Hoeflea poritis]MDA4844040.1 hypothetical protein [Hoeflea poritis]
MIYLLDKNPLEELYKLSQLKGLPGGIDVLAPFRAKGSAIVVLQDTLNEVRGTWKQEAIETWLKTNGVEIIEEQIENDAARAAAKRKYLVSQKGARRQSKQGSDTAMFVYLDRKRGDGRQYALVGRDADWADYRTKVKPEFVNSRHHSYVGLAPIYVEEVLNGRMSTAQLAGLFDHMSVHDLPDEYGLGLSEIKDRLQAEMNKKTARKKPQRVEQLKLKLLEDYVERAHKAARKENGKYVFTAKEMRNAAIVGGVSGGVLLEGMRQLSGPANALEIGLVYKEVKGHLDAGREDEAFKTIARFAAETAGGSAAGAAAAATAAIAAGTAGVTVGPWVLLATALVGGVAGSLAVGEPAEELAADFARYMASRHDEEAFTFDLLKREARRFTAARGVEPGRFDEVFNPQKTGRLRATAQSGDKTDRLRRGRPSIITLRSFAVDPADPSYFVDDDSHYFDVRDGLGGEWQIAVDHTAIESAPVVREDGHAIKRIEIDDGTFFYSLKSRRIYAYVPRVYPAPRKGEAANGRRAVPAPAPAPPDFLAPASPHYDPEMKIDFFGTPMRAGDVVDGDPDVGDVSYFPDDNDASLTSGSRQPRFRKVPIMDLLLRDGVLRNEKGEVIRASTGRPADQVYDRFVNMQLLDRAGKPVEGGAGRSRAGLRFILNNGADAALGDVFRRAVQFPDAKGNMRGGRPFAKNEGQPFYWIFRSNLPSPEDYVLQRSGFEPGYLRRGQEAANRFVRPVQAARPALPAIAPIPRPRPHRPLPQTGPVPSARRIKG